MFPIVLVTYLGLTLGILGAAGSVGTKGWCHTSAATKKKFPMTQQRVIQHKES